MLSCSNDLIHKYAMMKMLRSSYLGKSLALAAFSWRVRRRIQGESTALCLFMHKWVIKTESSARRDGGYTNTVIPYRECERCRMLQRGIFDGFWKDIVWETLREGTDVTSKRERFFRKPSGPLDQLAHSLGLRRSRVGDRTV